MDKSAIRNFAIEARKMLMKSAKTEAGFYGVTKNGCKSPIQKGNDFEVYETIAGTENRIYDADIKRRANLVKAVETLGFEQVIEETAYTWFNRIIAIRFMEVNDYLPTRVRVLSSETGSNTPDIVTQSLDVDLNMTSEELEKVQKAKNENRYDDAFRMLFIKQCNELNAILPGLFEKTDDYMELLLKLSYTSDGVIRMLVDSIDENNFNVETEGQVEIIGWMYQYYNTELKDDTFAKLKKNIKITKERIPAATQLFTPDWIVRYMVENSVGRVWIEHLRAVDSSIDEKEKAEEFGWKYYLPDAEQEAAVQAQLVEVRKSYANLEPKDINCIDPCMGSGHILVYMFDVLMDIYRSEGFSDRDAVFSILENNIRGLDIDKRAYQLSYFALMMKARGYNRTFFRGKQDDEGNRCFVEPLVFAIDESNSVNRNQLRYFGATLDNIENNNALDQISALLESLKDAKEYGSILDIDLYDWELLRRFSMGYDMEGQISYDTLGIDITQKKLLMLIAQGKTMADKYWVVATNPPYMVLSNGNVKLNNYVKKKYSNSRNDMFAVFIEKCTNMLRVNGIQAMITQHSWMFISSFEELRMNVLNMDFINLLHLGARAFDEIAGEVVQTVAWTMRQSLNEVYKGVYCRLVDGISENAKREIYLSTDLRYVASKKNFLNIPGSPIAYWLGSGMINLFVLPQNVGMIAEPRMGLTTGQNDKYLRLWYEVDFSDIGISKNRMTAQESKLRWFPYDKGGEYRKWYGNRDYVVDWYNDGYEMQTTMHPDGKRIWAHNFNLAYNFRPHISWNDIVTGRLAFRLFEEGFLFDSSSATAFMSEEIIYRLLGYLNSNVVDYLSKVLNPTLHFKLGDFSKLPYDEWRGLGIEDISKECVELCKNDWDSRETSWDFKKNPLVKYSSLKPRISDAVKAWKSEVESNNERLRVLEEQLNLIFVNLYDLEGEIDTSIEESAISITKKTEIQIVKEFILYAVGCMMGRYSLDTEGLVCTGNQIDISKYTSFIPDIDGIIPITDMDYFKDDIVSRFVEFVKICFGKENLEENLSYITNILEVRGNTSRDMLRNYFVSEFYKDNCNVYSITGSGKRPIYWLFDSGKQNGFKCLVYMHRYNKDTLNLIRSEYLHKTQNAVENALKNAEYMLQTSASAVERAKATKDRDKYVKQLNEMRIYYQALSHLALQKIEIDLDDGVKHNYQLFQGVEVIVDGGKKQTVNLLAKI